MLYIISLVNFHALNLTGVEGAPEYDIGYVRPRLYDKLATLHAFLI